jgi:hypothetical protein
MISLITPGGFMSQTSLARHGHTLILAMLAAALSSQAMAADAPPPIKPGLWEMVNEAQQLNGQAMPDYTAQMAQAMKDMPPHMRKQMEAQMKSHGVQMAPGAGGNMAMRMCLTPEMLSQNRWQKSDDNCKSEIVSRSGSTWKWKVTCPQGKGDGTTTFTSNEAYSTQMHMTMVQDGRPQNMTMKHRAKWLGADCGAVKPVSPPPAPQK